LLSLEQVEGHKAWLKNFTEVELEHVIPQIIRDTSYDYYVVVSDDVICSTDALNAVVNLLEVGAQVVTGYCNLDPVSEFCSLTKTPPTLPVRVETYDWMTLDEVHSSSENVIRTYHPSMALTGMSREMWEKFPWRCYGRNGRYGWAADLDLGLRLHAAEIPIFAPKDAFIYHTKPDWKLVDANMFERRRLRIDIEPSEVVFDIK